MKLKFAALMLATALAACGDEETANTDTATDENLAAGVPEGVGGGEGLNPMAGNEGGEGMELYQTYCATCHEGGVYKAPHVVNFQMSQPEYILAAMDGVMAQQSEDLSPEQRIVLAEFLTGSKVGDNSDITPPLECTPAQSHFDVDAPPPLNGWGMAPGHTRFIPGEVAGLKAADVPKLNLKWAFAYPGATRARSQPTIAGGSVYVGSQDGTIYALNEELGCVQWTFAADAEVRHSLTVTSWNEGDKDAQPAAYFGDFDGNVYRINARTGEFAWKVRADAHKDLTITGSPTLHDGVLYVPMSSREWASAADPGYACCTFRGGVVALDAETGEELWKTYSIPDDPRLTGETNSEGTPTFHPAGAPVWNSPAIDAKRNRLYVGTGEAYTSPAADTSDAVLAMDLTTGELLWQYQATAGDAWNMACTLAEPGPNCPAEDGPDFDFGASPVLVTLPTEEEGEEKHILLAGQKSGEVHALNPDTGELIWKKKVGLGGFAGGVHWGMTAHDGIIYVPIADTNFYNKWKGERKPGLFALDAATGDQIWFTPNPNVCPEDRKPACDPGLSAAVTSIPGVVFAGAFDGWLRAYDMADGRVIWETDTTQEVETVNGTMARGGSIEADGPVIVGGNVYINSGYLYGGRMAGNVLLVFDTKARATEAPAGGGEE